MPYSHIEALKAAGNFKHPSEDYTAAIGYSEFYRAAIGYYEHNLSEPQKKAALESVHENFWALPMQARTLYLEQMLFPVAASAAQEAESFSQSVAFVINQLLPDGTPYAQKGRDVLAAYLQQVPVAGQRLLLSALMVAGHQSGEAQTEEAIGKMLAFVLVNLGPAGVKLAQAIHSAPDTPEGIRTGMQGVKGDADLPLRWELFDRLNEAVPESVRAGIAFVRRILGGGAYQVTVEIEEMDGTPSALSLLRQHVRQRAETGFDIFKGTLELLIPKYPEFIPQTRILEQAARMVETETDYDRNERQSFIAYHLCEGRTVSVAGKTFDFAGVIWRGHGEEYKQTSLATGIDFNTLEAKTRAQQQEKKAAAWAIVAMEWYNIFSGKPFDHDVHGNNLKVDGNQIIHFDPGAMALTPPSGAEKKLLGKAIARAFKEARGKTEAFVPAFIRSLVTMQGDLPDSDYLATLQRALLAQNDYIKMLTGFELRGIVVGLFKTGAIDNTILYAAARELGYGALRGLRFEAGQAAEVTIHDPKAGQRLWNPKPPSYNPIRLLIDYFTKRALGRVAQQLRNTTSPSP